MKKIGYFLRGTAFIWLTFIACYIADKLAQIVTIDMIMKAVYIAIPILVIAWIRLEINERRG